MAATNGGGLPGTLDDTFDLVLQGALSMNAARNHARQLGEAGLLERDDLVQLARRCREVAQAGEARTAYMLIDLVYGGVLGSADVDQSFLGAMAPIGLDFIEVVHGLLESVPDAEIMNRAVGIGELLVEMSELYGTDGDDLAGEALHRMGTMVLDAYTATKPGGLNFLPAVWNWRHSLLHDPAYQSTDPARWLMPPIQEALPRAEAYFRRAAEFRDGNRLGLTLKAWAQALLMIEQVVDHADEDDPPPELIEPPDEPTDIDELLEQALELIDPEDNTSSVLWTLGILVQRGADPDLSPLDNVIDTSIDTWVDRKGPTLTADLTRQAVHILAGVDPNAALDYARRVDAFHQAYGFEAQRQELLDDHGRFFSRIVRDSVGWSFPDDTETSRTVAQAILDQAAEEDWDAAHAAMALLVCVNEGQRFNEEYFGLGIVDHIRQTRPVFAHYHAAMLAAAEARLWFGVGSNGYMAEEWAEAVAGYTRSMQAYLELDMPSIAATMLARIEDVTHEPSPDVAVVAALALAPASLRAELGIGDKAVLLVQRIAKRSIRNLADTGFGPDVLVSLLQMAKGQQFAAALTTAFHTSEPGDEERAILEQIADLEDHFEDEIEPLEAGLPPGLVLASYHDPARRQQGTSVADRLANLRRRFDELHQLRLARGAPSAESLRLDSDDIQASLDGRTALLDLYLGATSDGRLGVYGLLIDREEIGVGVVAHDFPDSEIAIGDEPSAMANPLAFTVDAIREGVERYPGLSVADADVLESLDGDYRAYLGHLPEQLQVMKERGIDHLCIVPHGPLHYHPLHLIGTPGLILADDFAVTYLPNLYLLARRGGAGTIRHRDRELTALGLSFFGGEPHGQAPLAQSIAEVTAVAAVFGRDPIVDDDATEAALHQALRSSRYVHLSTHGYHDIDAPAFQALLLTPTEDNNGVVHAYELAGLDLRGLELVTLSACETALGRFDRGDNLHGIPAALFRSGVETVIGTLWESEVHASELFFTELYKALSTGAGRLDAFRHAQLATRAAYPAYRDWGPFYLMGAWS
jgi:hypothetical protein